MGLSLDQLRVGLSLNENSVRTLEHMTLRAFPRERGHLQAGLTLSLLNASFAPVFQQSGYRASYRKQFVAAPFPSFNYEDLGLTIKVKPSVHGTSDVSMQVEILFRALGGQSLNGVPVISNREYKAGIALKEGEPAVVAGMVTKTEQKSLSGTAGVLASSRAEDGCSGKFQAGRRRRTSDPDYSVL